MKVVGQDNNGEPIWELTSEEYEQRKREFAAARERAKAKTRAQSAPANEPEPTPGAAHTSTDLKETAAQSPHAMELGAKIWEMRRRGGEPLRSAPTTGNSDGSC